MEKNIDNEILKNMYTAQLAMHSQEMIGIIPEITFFEFMDKIKTEPYDGREEFDLIRAELPDWVKELDLKSGVYTDDNIAWCLYSSFTGFNTPDIAMHKEVNKDKDLIYVGVIHGDVNGAITTTNRVTDNGLDPGIFDGCDFVIAGHIHKRQEIKKNGVRIVYCSSIRQRDMGESINGHGFVLWDVEDKEDIEYKYVDIPNVDGGYYKFVVNSISDIENDKEELLNY